MQYRNDPKSGSKLSILGFGCMRFPRNLARIDMYKTEQLVVKAVEKGINYFDTAYIYGGSEDVLGQIIQKNNLRDKIFLATKLPLAKCRSHEDFDELFKTQLERLRTDYIDYYLLHNLTGTDMWEQLRGKGVEKWIEEKKASGKIRQIGFSFHGVHGEFLALLEAYNWDFCQIQYNYINTDYQAGTAGLKKAAEKGIPVIVMEPLLGGKLANALPKKALDTFRAADSSLPPAAWALRWLWNQKEVTVVLSGMNEDSQLTENINIAHSAKAGMLGAKENEVFKSVTEVFKASFKIPCTGCNYCMPCPQNVNIPACFSAYNISYTSGIITGFVQYLTSIGVSNPSKLHAAFQCIKCGACEKKCPQHIPVVKALGDVRKRMEPFWLRAGLRIFLKSQS
jgi:predicted aldo/keto reductase-like oxidoreductase